MTNAEVPTPENTSWTINRILIWSTKYLENLGITSARLDCELMLGKVLSYKRIDLYLNFDKPLDQSERDHFRMLLKRRANGEPVAYITGEREFYGRVFSVNNQVLIPRSETELLIDTAMEAYNDTTPETALDIGTGSGCIAITLALAWEKTKVEAWDICDKALAIAQTNATRLKAAVHFTIQDALKPEWQIGRTFACIVSNPPYIATSELAAVDCSVKNYEPHKALFAGDGLDFYKNIARNSLNCIKSKGKIFLEIGYQQGLSVTSILENCGWENIAVIKDYAGHDRVIAAQAPG